MAMPCVHLLLLFCSVPASIASPRGLRLSPAYMAPLDDAATPSPPGASRPTTYFEVDRPLRPPPGSSGPCSTLLLSHSFGFTFTKHPATAAYSPPRCLAAAFSLAVIEWHATCQGVQYDRIFGVWLGGAVWPFPVIYTGGIYPLPWRPITGIGSFNLPTYDIELTLFLGKLWDGKAHEFGFAVTNALDMWYVTANLHIWLDSGSTATTASLVSHDAPELSRNTTPSQSGGPDDMKYHTTASRHISAAGWVKSSHGNITTNSTQTFAFENTVTLNNDTADTVNQTTVAHTGILVTDHPGVLYSVQALRNFPL